MLLWASKPLCDIPVQKHCAGRVKGLLGLKDVTTGKTDTNLPAHLDVGFTSEQNGARADSYLRLLQSHLTWMWLLIEPFSVAGKSKMLSSLNRFFDSRKRCSSGNATPVMSVVTNPRQISASCPIYWNQKWIETTSLAGWRDKCIEKWKTLQHVLENGWQLSIRDLG